MKVFSNEVQEYRSLIETFNFKESVAWKGLTSSFCRKLNLKDLMIIATQVSEIAKITIPRNSKRRKPPIFKWFCNYWEIIKPLLKFVSLPPEEEKEENEKVDDIHLNSNTQPQNQFQMQQYPLQLHIQQEQTMKMPSQMHQLQIPQQQQQFQTQKTQNKENNFDHYFDDFNFDLNQNYVQFDCFDEYSDLSLNIRNDQNNQQLQQDQLSLNSQSQQFYNQSDFQIHDIFKDFDDLFEF